MSIEDVFSGTAGTGGAFGTAVSARLGVAGLDAAAVAGGVTELALSALGRREDLSGIGGGMSESMIGNLASCGPKGISADVRFELLPLVDVLANDSVVDGGLRSPV